MKIFKTSLILVCFAFTVSTIQAQAYCKRCEDARAYILGHPENNFEYYEDYLKAQEAAKNTEAPKNQEETE